MLFDKCALDREYRGIYNQLTAHGEEVIITENRQTILHSDMNSFYASVEMMLNPDLKGKAIAVCGSTEDRHGIVLAKSEKAKKYGVKTGMVNFEARQRCPKLILVPPQYDQYLKYSKLAHEIYYRYTDQVEPFGMDECWLDVTHSVVGSGLAIAEEIRQAVREELGLTVSIGVSFNKIFAKLGSDMKKPDAITVISPDDFKEKVWPLPASDLLYVGRSTEHKLSGFGIHTIGELAATPPEMLKRWFGVNGIKLWHYANGTDNSRVMHKDFVSPVKSIGHGITCVADLKNEEEVYRVMLELSQDIGHKLRVNGLIAAGVQVCVRSNDLSGRQYQMQFDTPTRSPKEIADTARILFNKQHQWTTPVRAVTVRAINLMPQAIPVQTTIFSDPERLERIDRLETAIEDIRRRYGKHSIINATLLGDLKMPGDNRCEVIMPGLMYQ